MGMHRRRWAWSSTSAHSSAPTITFSSVKTPLPWHGSGANMCTAASGHQAHSTSSTEVYWAITDRSRYTLQSLIASESNAMDPWHRT